MRPRVKSYKRLGITQSKAKMYEYKVDERDHITIPEHPEELFPFTIGLIGDATSRQSSHEHVEEDLSTYEIENLTFSARFFDSYIKARFTSQLDNDLYLLGTIAYYMANLQGSAQVLAKEINLKKINDSQIKIFLYALLTNPVDREFHIPELQSAWDNWLNFVQNGTSLQVVFQKLAKIREDIYSGNSSVDLFFIDALICVLKKKHQNSCWVALPKYSGLDIEIWRSVIKKEGFIKELWPAQHLLGVHGILKGKSAVVQMPTSTGKTKSAEFIIRSSFLSGRSKIALIVAPFRALCHEIREDLLKAFQGEDIKISEISDVLQIDVDMVELFGGKQKKVFVLTPEKLLYILRQEDDLSLDDIGLVIFDEGHQFDSGSRGITYELLLTSLRRFLPAQAQKILISAVISNSEDVGTWLNGEDNTVVQGNNLNPTYKTLGFASWIDRLGQIKFVNKSNIEEEDFFVPRILQKIELEKRPRERVARYFPEKDDGKSIALFLGLKLSMNGGVAIFCGNKGASNKILENLIDLKDRNYSSPFPRDFSNLTELECLKNLICLNLGADSSAAKAADLGVFAHHASCPQGIRVAVESAMRSDHIKCVVCTSTLAQGVNLPIKYLVVTSIYQGGGRLKVRDFQNLIGRAGRSGKHTEGSILFADPKIFDKQRQNDPFRWNNIKELLNIEKSEDCTSTLLSIFDPFVSDNGRAHLNKLKILNFLTIYFSDNKASLEDFPERVERSYGDKKFTAKGIKEQLNRKLALVFSIQGFLMAHINDDNFNEDFAISLCEETLAYSLAKEDIKAELKKLFLLIFNDLKDKSSSQEQRKHYSQTLLGFEKAQEIELWLKDNVQSLFQSDGDAELLEIIWPILGTFITNKMFASCSNMASLFNASLLWIQGNSYADIYAHFQENGIEREWGESLREYTIDNIVEIFDQGMSYDGALIIGAISSIVPILSTDLIDDEAKEYLIKRLYKLQKRVKYGLSSKEEIDIFEVGFCDRVIASKIFLITGPFPNDPESAKHVINQQRDSVREMLNDMPKHYQDLLNNL